MSGRQPTARPMVRGSTVAGVALAGALAGAVACSTGSGGRGARAGAAPEPAQCRAAQTGAAAPGTVYALSQVEQPPVPVRANPEPAWPSLLGTPVQDGFASDRKQYTQGEVTLSYTVDSLGCTVPGSARVVASTDSLFTNEVLAVLPRLRYTPALRGGQPVASELVWKFLFYRRAGAAMP